MKQLTKFLYASLIVGSMFIFAFIAICCIALLAVEFSTQLIAGFVFSAIIAICCYIIAAKSKSIQEILDRILKSVEE